MNVYTKYVTTNCKENTSVPHRGLQDKLEERVNKRSKRSSRKTRDKRKIQAEIFFYFGDPSF
jgi:hypothetical protein